jgi:DNA polymerase-3 subunit alpha
LYTVNSQGNIRYGLGGAAGVGKAAVDAIIAERQANGPYQSFFDFIKRVNLRAVNKRTIETLVKAGAFDCFEGTHRAQYFQETAGTSFIEKAIKFGQNYKKNQESLQTSLFGNSAEVQIPEPEIPDCEPWSQLQKLEKEKEVTGIYLSGHPLDTFDVEYKYYAETSIAFVNKMIETLSGKKDDDPKQEGDELIESEEEKAEKVIEYQKFEQLLNKEIVIAGMVVGANHFETRNGKQKGTLTIEDYTDSIALDFWNEDYLQFAKYFVPKIFVIVRLKISRSFYNPNQLRIKVISMNLLNEVFEKNPKGLTLNLYTEELDKSMIDNLSDYFNKFKGNQKIKIHLIDRDNPELSIPINSKLGIKVTRDLIKFLENDKYRFHLK